MEKQRRTSKFKAQVVLELLKGGSLEELSRKYAVTMAEINAWRDEAVRKRFGMIRKDICKGMGLSLRADHGSQYDSHDFKSEMDFLGLEMSHSFVRSPECNGCIERFNHTIEEEVLSINTFYSMLEAEEAISQFMERYNSKWMLHRLGLQSPKEYREAYEFIHRAI